MAPTVAFYCSCLSDSSPPPSLHTLSSSDSAHSLGNLFFCDGCDAIRCNQCVLAETSGYYCPNCLFEVPNADVHAQDYRCARSCFSCPNCCHTLSVVGSDPPVDVEPPVSTFVVGQPPFLLYCNHCRWDSADVGITFERPSRLATQMEEFKDSVEERAHLSLHASSPSVPAPPETAARIVRTDSKPIRTPLQSKKSKRCLSCRRVLIQPEPKLQSVRYKTKLVAANYLPAIMALLPQAQAAIEPMEPLGETGAVEQETAGQRLIPGHSYPFHLAFTNPLQIPIQVQLAEVTPTPRAAADSGEEQRPRSAFQIRLPRDSFPVAAFVEAKEDKDSAERPVGIAGKPANTTVVNGELVVSEEARGDVRFGMLVSYTHRGNDPKTPEKNEPAAPSGSLSHENVAVMKTLSFYTLVSLGPIVDASQERRSETRSTL